MRRGQVSALSSLTQRLSEVSGRGAAFTASCSNHSPKAGQGKGRGMAEAVQGTIVPALGAGIVKLLD